MNGPEVLVPLAFFATVATIFVSILRYKERTRAQPMPMQGEIATRLERMEQAIDSIAVEVERISEGQRFTTRLLSERGDPLPVIAQENARERAASRRSP